jgi:hypothetical protein
MLLFFVACALVFGAAEALDVGPETAWFAVGVFAVAALIANLMHAAQGRCVTIHETDSQTDAFLCAQLLREQGVAAEIRDGDISGLAGVRHRPWRVEVPTAQADRAAELLAEQQGWGEADDDDSERPVST